MTRKLIIGTFIATSALLTVLGCRPKIKPPEAVPAQTTPSAPPTEKVVEPLIPDVAEEECLDLYKDHSIDVDKNGVTDMCDPKGIWVSADEGDDSIGNGNLLKPFKSIKKGLEKLKGTKDRLFVVQGVYAESNTINAGVAMIGGYSLLAEGVRFHDPKKFETTISPAIEGSFALEFVGGAIGVPAQLVNFTLGVMWKQVPSIIRVEDASPKIIENRINVGGGAQSSVGISIRGTSRPLIEGNEITIHGTTSVKGYAMGVEAVVNQAGKRVRPKLKNNVILVTGVTGASGTIVGINERKENEGAEASLDMEGNQIRCVGRRCSARFFYGVLLGETVYGSVFSFDEALLNGNRFDNLNLEEGGRSSAIQAKRGRVYLSNNILRGGESSKGGAVISLQDSTLEMDFNTLIAVGASNGISSSGGVKLSLRNNIFYVQDGLPIVLTGSGNSIRLIHNNLFSPPGVKCMIGGAKCLGSNQSITDAFGIIAADNIKADPMFGPDGLIGSSESAAVGTGSCLPNIITHKDINGVRRPKENKCDIGAHEYVPQ